MIKRPILCMLAAYCLGILCKGRYTAVTLSVLFLYIFLLIYMKVKPSFVRKIQGFGLTLIFIPAVFLLGAMLAGRQDRVHNLDLMLAATKAGKADGAVTGRLSSVNATEKGYKLLLTKALVSSGGVEYKAGRVILYLDDASDLTIGNSITAMGSIRSFSEDENPGQFDEKGYYRAKRIVCKFYATEAYATDDSCDHIKEFFRRLRERLSLTYDRVFPAEEAGVIKAVLLGDKSDLSEETNELYRQNGIAHILAISGLHVSLLGKGLFKLLRLCKSPLLPAAAVTSMLVLGYGCMTDFGISTIRAVVMLIISLLAKIFGRSYDQREACALCGFFILLREPLQLFQLSFRLSFVAAIGIAAFNTEFTKWKKNSGRTGEKMLGTMLSGLAPQLVTTPIILQGYYEIPLYAFFINLLVVPGLSLLVSLGLLVAAVGTVSVKLARIPAGGAYCILRIYKLLCIFMMKLPNPVILYGNPGTIRIILCYGLILLFFALADVIGRKYRHSGKSELKRPLAALVLLLAPLMFIKLPDNSLHLSQLSVGQGDCCVLSAKGSCLIVDCGSMNTGGISKYRLEPFLKYNGISKIDAIFITHPDKDHISGVTELLERITNSPFYTGTVAVKKLVMTEAACLSPKTAELRRLAEEKGVELVQLEAGDIIVCGTMKLTCISPLPEHDDAENEGSIVLHVGYGDFDALLMGDSSKEGERAAIAAVNSGLFTVPIEYLKVSHHGSKTASSQEFLEIMRPEISVISYGRGNIYGHPNQGVLERLNDIHSVIYRTGATGAACFRIKMH